MLFVEVFCIELLFWMAAGIICTVTPAGATGEPTAGASALAELLTNYEPLPRAAVLAALVRRDPACNDLELERIDDRLEELPKLPCRSRRRHPWCRTPAP